MEHFSSDNQPSLELAQLPNFPNSGATPIARSSRPSKDDWTAHQMRIKQLYLNENKKLREVMYIMKTEFKFHAT